MSDCEIRSTGLSDSRCRLPECRRFATSPHRCLDYKITMLAGAPVLFLRTGGQQHARATIDRVMRRCLVRAVVVAIMALVAGRPILLDRCVLACAHDTAAATPRCHHADDESRTRVDAPSGACGHDHSAVLLGANSTASDERLVTIFAVAQHVAILPDVGQQTGLPVHPV